jgi:nicotinamidase-related amidase
MSALLLIECQNEWLSTKGKLHGLIEDKAMFNRSVKNISKALEMARNMRMPVAHVGLGFQKGYPELANGKSGLNKTIPSVGTFQLDSFGAEFYEPFRPIEGEFIIKGRCGASGFAGSNLDAWLRKNRIEDLYLVGYATHVCVESTMREAHDKGYNPILLEDATSAFNRKQQDYILNEIVHHFGQHLPTKDFISEL